MKLLTRHLIWIVILVLAPTTLLAKSSSPVSTNSQIVGIEELGLVLVGPQKSLLAAEALIKQFKENTDVSILDEKGL